MKKKKGTVILSEGCFRDLEAKTASGSIRYKQLLYLLSPGGED